MSNREKIKRLVNQIGDIVSQERWLADEAISMLREAVHGPEQTRYGGTNHDRCGQIKWPHEIEEAERVAEEFAKP